ncbi:hypothetical protein, partial [Yersinia rochesterensis]|uniref:hypothetical protein n=1 Tax=Yersinia rochesterensis TaxID=1604335 RepID=UPI001C95F941
KNSGAITPAAILSEEKTRMSGDSDQSLNSSTSIYIMKIHSGVRRKTIKENAMHLIFSGIFSIKNAL